MTSNISKWFPKTVKNNDKVFERTKHIERELRILGKKFATNINFNLLDYYAFQMLLDQGKAYFQDSCYSQYQLYRMGSSSSDKNVERSSFKVLLNKKALLISRHLRKRHFQLIFIISKLIKQMLCNGIFEAAFYLCSLLNNIVILTAEQTRHASGTLIVSNTCPTLLSNPKRMDISSILQLITRYRTESCCASLISCLLTNYRDDMNEEDDDDDDDDSSIEVFRALTSQLHTQESEDLIQQHQNLKQSVITTKKEIKLCTIGKPPTIPSHHINDPVIDFFDKMTGNIIRNDAFERNESEESEILIDLIRTEDIFIAHIIAKGLKLCPSAFDENITKSQIMKLITKASRFLWTHVSGTLEHFVLWWNQAPLACRPVGCAKYLRDWLLIQPDAPEPILSTLKSLGEILTVHVIGTTWDKQFRVCLVLANGKIDQVYDKNSELYCPNEKLQGTTPGYFWCELFQLLVSITNSCDRAGTIANELPIVEQIPVLHRLDHSVHTMRLWAATRAKELCSDWNTKMFFRVVHNDIFNCLEHLNDLRMPELSATNPLEVHIQVNVALREKLVSEVRVNREKAKKTCNECVDVLALVCETTSRATLNIYFPPVKIWQIDTLKTKPNQYVDVYLDIMYMPVINATKDIEILSLTLKIICESLLEHIYAKRIKFSYCGAINLQKDFEGVAAWIRSCEELPEFYREKLAKHEVLKMCEGVGKILLREPDEVISMFPAKAKGEKGSEATDDDEDKAPLPAEMFVSNQQRWMKLRARKRFSLESFLCGGVNII